MTRRRATEFEAPRFDEADEKVLARLAAVGIAAMNELAARGHTIHFNRNQGRYSSTLRKYPNVMNVAIKTADGDSWVSIRGVTGRVYISE